MLLDGGAAGGKGECGSSEASFITGQWWGDLVLSFSVVCVLVVISVVIVVLFLTVAPFRAVVLGKEGERISRARSGMRLSA